MVIVLSKNELLFARIENIKKVRAKFDSFFIHIHNNNWSRAVQPL